MNHSINETISQTSTVLGYQVPLTNSVILDIYLITLLVALFITLVNKYLTDQVMIKALKKETKSLQKKIREEMKTDPKKAQKLQQKSMKKSIELMKHTINPKMMLVTILPLLLVFTFIGKLYGPFGEFLNLGFTEFGWLGTYILFSIINSILLKKVLDVA